MITKHRFICRTPNIDLTVIKDELDAEIDNYCSLHFTDEELNYLKSLGYFKEDFINYLKKYQANRNCIKTDIVNGKLTIEIEGFLINTIFFEVPVLAMVNELYFMNKVKEGNIQYINDTIPDKLRLIKVLNDFKFVEFGTRRRFSKLHQGFVIRQLKKDLHFKGTSNVYFAMIHKIPVSGTMAHEYIQAFQAIMYYDLKNFQKEALESWAKEYRGELAIALTDTIGIDTFLSDFDLYLAKLYDGVRHDSGDPFIWGDKIIEHYKKLGIDARNKTLVFSDGLDFPKAIEIYKYYVGRTNVVFGIGTNLTNDTGIFQPINIVIKMVECNRKPVAKISDERGKEICEDAEFLNRLKSTFGIGE